MTTTTDRSELLEQLSEGIANLTTPDEWQRYLDCQSRFYSYSSNNVMLIAQQAHEANRVAGFNAWKRLGRFVQKGEKAIWNLAPMVYKQTDEKTDEEQKVIRGFKWVPVFDVASTDGEDLPTVCHKLSGDNPAGIFARLIEFATSIGFMVEDARLPGSVNGDCTHELHRIRVEIYNSPAPRVKTLTHEIRHALLHEQCDNRALAELDAESTTHVIGRHLASTRATTPTGTSRAGLEVANRPSPGSKDRTSESRRLQHPSCSPSRSNRNRRHELPYS